MSDEPVGGEILIGFKALKKNGWKKHGNLLYWKMGKQLIMVLDGATIFLMVQIIEHGGGANGFVSDGIRIPSQQLYVEMLSNICPHL